MAKRAGAYAYVEGSAKQKINVSTVFEKAAEIAMVTKPGGSGGGCCVVV